MKENTPLNLIVNYLLGFLLSAVFLYYLFPYYQLHYIPKVSGLSSIRNYPKSFDILMSYVLIFVPSLFLIKCPLQLKHELKFPIVTFRALERAESFLARHRYLPYVFMAIACLTRFSNLPRPHDSYHFGEYVLPNFLRETFGALPYIDVIPSHGLVNYLPSVLFGSAPANVYLGYALITLVLNLTLGTILVRKSENKLLAVLTMFLMPSERISYLAVLVSFVLWKNILRFSQTLDCILAAALMIFFGFFEVSTGIALAAIYGMAFMYYLSQNPKNLRQVSVLTLPFLFLAILLAMPWTQSILISMLMTVKKLASFNLESFGIPFIDSLNDRVSILLIKFGFIPLCSMLVYKVFSHSDKNSKLLLGSLVIFTLMLMGYSMGRIDPGGISRSGWLTGLLFFCVLFHESENPKAAFGLVLLVLALLATTKIDPIYRTPSRILKNYSAMKKPGYYREASLVALKKKLDLSQNDFLDLTNNNLNYYFLNMRPPLKGLSMFNTVDPDEWIQLSKKISQFKLILLEQEEHHFHDGLSLKERSRPFYEALQANCYLHHEQVDGMKVLIKSASCKTNIKKFEN